MSAKDMFDLVDYSPEDIGYAANYDPAKHGGAREGNDQVFLHHPGFKIREAADGGNVNSEKAVLRGIEENAMNGDWWGMPYDVIVGQSGKIYAGRGLARSGATSGDVDGDGTHNNDEGEAIMVLVRPNTPMTQAARDSLVRLFDAHGGDVIGHKDAGGIATSCPGDERLAFIYAYNNGDFDEGAEEPKTTPKPKSGHWTEKVMTDLKMLRKGDRDLQVTKVQALLNATRQHSLAEDGVFGPLTEKAVYEYQSDRSGLSVDGIVGPKTWGALLTRH